eukprot:TRINITY_DN16409_c0_g1_i2.p1 TRINITY_DN16409_c0_g1~~TRINITY_DN16409_c0_g1_i2.p1  ORF type:complete len:342 (-),score=68.82 TRINITY_DN16409_c0_g1_i2:332-1207(-)
MAGIVAVRTVSSSAFVASNGGAASPALGNRAATAPAYAQGPLPTAAAPERFAENSQGLACLAAAACATYLFGAAARSKASAAASLKKSSRHAVVLKASPQVVAPPAPAPQPPIVAAPVVQHFSLIDLEDPTVAAPALPADLHIPAAVHIPAAIAPVVAAKAEPAIEDSATVTTSPTLRPARFAGGARQSSFRQARRSASSSSSSSRAACRAARRSMGARLQPANYQESAPLSFDPSCLDSRIQSGLRSNTRLRSPRSREVRTASATTGRKDAANVLAGSTIFYMVLKNLHK